MPFDQVNRIINAANEVCQEAFAKLVAEGFSHEVAEDRVKRNFLRVNKNPNLVLTVEELCK